MTLTTERPTISGTDSDSFEAMLDLLDELNVPDGYKTEIIKGASSCRLRRDRFRSDFRKSADARSIHPQAPLRA